MASNSRIEIIGTNDDDLLQGTSTSFGPNFGNDFISGLRGNDRILALSGDDHLDGGPGNDELDGGPGSDTANYLSSPGRVDVDLDQGTAKESPESGTLSGTEDKLISIENILGSDFGDRLVGNGDVNEISGSDGDDTIVGRGGDDALRGDAGDDDVSGGAGDDDLFGAEGSDRLRGGAGEDELSGGEGSDDIFGGEGNDTLRGGAGPDELRGGPGDDVVRGASGDDRLFGGAGADELHGGSGDDLVSGGIGDDRLFGGGGKDELSGDAGDEEIDGGAGEDTVSYSDSPKGVRVDLDRGEAEDGFGTTDALSAIENIDGSANDDVLIGDDGPNRIEGRGGRDIIEGLGGADIIDGGDGIDRVDYELSPAGVIVDLAAGEADDGFGSQDTLRDIEDILGSFFDDALAGDGSFNVIEGLAGNDVIDGRGGFDTADYFFSPDRVVADLAAGRAARDGWQSEDTLIAMEGIRGSDFADTLRGDDSANVLDGGFGADRLTGRGGADVFRFTAAGQGLDTITDFDLAEDDVIDLREALTGFDPETSDPGDFVDVVASGGDTTLQVDPDGGGDSFVDLALLEGVAGTSLADLLGSLVLSEPAAASA